MITADKAILLLIDNYEGKIRGKTLIQKRIYFLCNLLKEDMDFGYDAHYYGPYSSEVEEGLSLVKSLGFIEEHTLGFGTQNQDGFEIRRYDYSLTEDGKTIVRMLERKAQKECEKIRRVLKKMQDAGDNGDYVSLSIAAKTYHILSRKTQPMTTEAIHSEAKKFGWNIKPESIDRASSFLEKLNLVKKTANG
ncbi:MAG: hypothetical protein HQK89_04045 [Nitrospirae bacterium]|nr:hypothetical protein [Nitrospirota bacterium]